MKFLKFIKSPLILLVLIFIIMGLNGSLKAQRLETSVYLQETVLGLQKGYSVGFVTNNKARIAVFYQSNRKFSFTENGSGNYPFYGGIFSYDLTSCSSIMMRANLKAGIVNGQFVSISPEIETVKYLNKYLDVSVGAGLRAGAATASIKLTVKLF